MPFRLPRLRDELVTDKPGSALFRRWWNLLAEQVEATDTELRAEIEALSQTVTDTAIDNDSRYVRGDGTISSSAATTTHKLAWTDPTTGAVYYILMSNV